MPDWDHATFEPWEQRKARRAQEQAAADTSSSCGGRVIVSLPAEKPYTPGALHLRAIRPLNLAGLVPGEAATGAPEFREVYPSELVVDEAYQRNLSERSINLIRRIVAKWDWRRFKPPVVAVTDEGLEVIDGQHTAIAACTHPGVEKIPVMVVDAASQAARADAFIGHNRDRLGMTPMQIHYAALAAGDEDAQTIDQVCGRAAVRILRATPGNGVWLAGETVAVTAIGALVSRRGALKARVVLHALSEARLAPISTSQIKAAELVLYGKEYGDVEAADLSSAILSLGSAADQEARVFAAAHRVPIWQALGAIYYRRATRGRRRAS